MRALIAVSFITLAISPLVAQIAPSPVTLMPGEIKYAPLPFAQGVDAAWLAGGPAAEGAYTVRVRISRDAKIPPHTHPDTRQITVLSGELFAGTGTAFDANAVKAYPAGSFFTMPAGVPHYVWAKNGETVYQESGNGPSPTALVK
jgi:quercetin dioxygenase-like cupin family protein